MLLQFIFQQNQTKKLQFHKLLKFQKSSLPIASPTKDIPLSSDRNILSETTDRKSKTLHKAEDSIELSNTDSLANIKIKRLKKKPLVYQIFLNIAVKRGLILIL